MGSIARPYAVAQHAAAHLKQRSAELADTGQTQASLDAIRRAVEILVHADVAPEDDALYRRQLADIELDLTFRLLSTPYNQFVTAANDAIAACQRSVAAGNEPVYVASELHTLSSWAADRDGAIQTAIDAAVAGADLLRPLSPQAGEEAPFYRTFAILLLDVFTREVTAGRPDLAATPAEEAIQAYRQLAAAGVSAIDVSDALMTLSLRVSLLDPPVPPAAVDAAQAAVDLLEAPLDNLAADVERRARLAQATFVLAERLVSAGRPAEAVGPAQRAVELYRELADADASYAGLLSSAQALVDTLG